MNRPLPERYKNLPSALSMDYRMSPDNFWVFWTRSPPVYEELEEILQGFALANPGIEGILEMDKAECGEFVFAWSLEDLRKVMSMIDGQPSSFQSKLPTWLGGLEKYVVVFEQNQEIKTVFTDSRSEQESHLQVLEKNPGVEIKWIAPIKPLKDLLTQMEAILEAEDYTKIKFDRRVENPEKGFPWDWIFFMKRPESYSKAKKAQEYFDNNPGAWEEGRRLNLEDLKNGVGPICEE